MINQHVESNFVNSESKKPRNEEEEWMTLYKYQCQKGEHTKAELAEHLGMKDTTFRSKVLRKKLEITYGGIENCEFCRRLQMKEPAKTLEVNEQSTPKRKVEIIRNRILADSNPFVTPKAKVSNESPSSNTTLTPDTPSKGCVITNEMLLNVATKCNKHTYDQIGAVLGVNGPSLRRRVIRAKLKLTNTEEHDAKKCYFCQCTDICQNTTPKITKEMMEKIETKCDKHTYDQIAKHFGVQGKNLSQRIKRTGVALTNDPEKCFFLSK